LVTECRYRQQLVAIANQHRWNHPRRDFFRITRAFLIARAITWRAIIGSVRRYAERINLACRTRVARSLLKRYRRLRHRAWLFLPARSRRLSGLVIVRPAAIAGLLLILDYDATTLEDSRARALRKENCAER